MKNLFYKKNKWTIFLMLIVCMITACSLTIDYVEPNNQTKIVKESLTTRSLDWHAPMSIPLIKLYICTTSQSNAQNLPPSAFNYEYASGVKAFNFTTRVWNDSLSWNQLQKVSGVYAYSPLITLARKLKLKYPNDDLRFLQYSQGNTDLYTTWNVNNTTSTSLFKKSVAYINQALSSMPTPDEVYIVTFIGENDAQDLTKANAFYQNEGDNYDSLRTLYNVKKYIVYVPHNNAPYLSIVKAAKYAHESADSTYEAIEIPVTGNYQSGNVHMNATGVRLFVDSAMFKL